MSLSNNYPTIKPSLLLDFANVNQLDPRITFTRTSTATYYNSNGLLTSAALNTPRFDYNPSTLAPQGQLLEEQRTNLLTYSSEFDNAAWTKTNSNISANMIVAPDGAFSADKIVESTATGVHDIRRINISASASTAYTQSAYIKSSERTKGEMQLFGNSGGSTITFDLTAGTVTVVGAYGGWSSASATIANVGNGWYRLTHTATTNTGLTLLTASFAMLNAAGSASYAGDGTSGIYYWGAQLEAGAFPTSYVPSTNTFTSRSTTGSFVDSTGTLQSAAINVARNTYNPSNLTAAPFLLLEEARTNSIRNSTMVGAIAGTPGTLPTNWFVSTSGGLSTQVVGTGVQNGITYIDIRAFGTSTGTLFVVRADAAIAALNGQTWTISQWVSIVGGSLTNVNSVILAAGISAGTSQPTLNFTPTTTFTRYLATATLNADANLDPRPFGITFNNGVAIDITLRIGLPQLEQGYGATSVIPNSPTFTSRASAATYYNASGLVTSAATNVARLNYNPANLTQPANLILEAAATNLLTYSSEFDNAAWTKTRASVFANAIASPDGNINADKLVEDTTASNSHFIDQTASFTSGSAYTYTVYAKDAGRRYLQILLTSTAFGANIVGVFDLVSGTSTQNSGSATITAVGNSWYRCSLTATATSTSGATAQLRLADSYTTTPASYTGDGVSGIYIWGAQLETGSAATTYVPSTNTFISRASTGSYFDSAGVLQSAAIDVARNTYNPANLAAAPFLLLEEARTNLLTYSDQFNNAAWTQVAQTLTANSATAPDSTVTADTIIPSTLGSTTHYIYQLASLTINVVYSISVYAKPAGYNRLLIRESTSAGYFAAFDVSTGTVVGTNGSTANIVFAGNGWYRCTMTFTGPATASTTMAILNLPNTGTSYADATFAGNGTSGVYIWGAQLEAGYGSTSYIPTTTAAVTRAADVSSSAATTRAADVYSQAALTRAADVSSSAQTTRAADVESINTLAPWYNPAEGTFFVESLPAFSGNNVVISASDLTNNNAINIFYGSNVVQFQVRESNVTQASLIGTTSTAFKMAGAYKANDFAASLNGLPATTDNAGAIPAISNLTIGVLGSGGSRINGYIRRIAYYPKRLSNTELQGLTS